ncbi:hypothetical protein L596_027158 [Steinernema carpocapsae]|nr:hypothetical protein L596_027158 [Steinernema carpocapsae]
MGAAFSSFTQYAHSFFTNTNFSLPASTSRFCKPYDWFYDYKRKGIGIKLACANCQYPLMTYPEQWTSIYDPKNNEKTACSYECLSQQLDPIAYKYRDHRWVSCGGNDISDVYSQIYRVFYVYAITDGKDVYTTQAPTILIAMAVFVGYANSVSTIMKNPTRSCFLNLKDCHWSDQRSKRLRWTHLRRQRRPLSTKMRTISRNPTNAKPEWTATNAKRMKMRIKEAKTLGYFVQKES